MPTVTKRSPRIRFEFVPARKQSTLGGLPALEALAQQFDLWQTIRALPGLAPRTRTSHGYSPELIVAQLIYCFCSGGASLADAERLNDEPLVRQLARVKKFADQTQLGEWLRQQNDTSIAALWQLIAEFVQWVIAWTTPPRWATEPSSIPFRESSDSKTPFATPPQPLAKDSGGQARRGLRLPG